MPPTPHLTIGQTIKKDGCFTEEFFIRGMSANRIGRELGLPPQRMGKGIYIAFAIELPSYHQFHLGGWARYETSLFTNYESGKAEWSEEKFEETYAGKRFPISIDEAKKAWLKNMRKEKLVKVIPVIPHQEYHKYPPGGRASQIIVTQPIKCQVVKFLESHEIFRGVWG